MTTKLESKLTTVLIVLLIVSTLLLAALAVLYQQGGPLTRGGAAQPSMVLALADPTKPDVFIWDGWIDNPMPCAFAWSD